DVRFIMNRLDKSKRGWWEKAVFYELYPKSFQDTDGATFGLAITTFVGQIVGIGDYKRAKRGTLLTLALTYATIIFLIGIVWIFSPPIARIFNATPEVVDTAVMLLRTITPFFLFCPLNQVLAGSLRGLGKSTAPMIAMLTCFVGLRQVYLFVMSNYLSNSLLSIVLSYPVGWFTCAIFITTLYFILHKNEEKKHVGEQALSATENQ
ncbi:MAG: hypothetical protein IKC72_04830, partial [Clostridia bacterium]|nr:hypothetical protein [Clostridia bacterium]